MPALFLTQWVSCDGIEPLSNDAWGQVIRSIAQRSGAVLLRVDRSSGGDSEGPGCHELDHDTEVSQYRQALDQLTRDPWVDARRIVILGLSLGSTTAPLVAQGRPVAGVVVSGAGGLTYFERLLAFDRLAFERAAEPVADIDARMNRHAEFLVEYLLREQSPAEIATRHPHLATTWGEMRGTGIHSHYGRPFAWHRQAARRDLLAAWDRVEAPVLVVYGEFDQFEPPHAFRAIVDRLERRRPGSARAVEVAGMSHFYEVHPTAVDAMAGRYTVGAPELAAVPILASCATARGSRQQGPRHEGAEALRRTALRTIEPGPRSCVVSLGMEELGSLAPAVDASALEPTRGRRPAEPDAQLLDRLRRRDHLAFDALVASYGGHVLALATHFDPPTAADVTQEVFLRVWLRIADYQGRARFSTWLYRIVRNAAADARRARWRRREEPLAAFALHLRAAAAAPSGAEARIDLERALAELSPRLRWPIVLRFVAGLEYDEIALALECPVGTVSSRLRRGLRQLEGHLRGGAHRQSERNAGRRRVAQIAVGAGLVALSGALVLSLLRVPPRIEERAGPLDRLRERRALGAPEFTSPRTGQRGSARHPRLAARPRRLFGRSGTRSTHR